MVHQPITFHDSGYGCYGGRDIYPVELEHKPLRGDISIGSDVFMSLAPSHRTESGFNDVLLVS